ncbi:transposase family protein [Crocosphaera sp. UHCC 0190]|uniref:transposase family protein n=1 Tax=Crocosphaera sp. UHCC 0190 TaxID=3110246 RepID=UPI002B20C365|nr:transposase family protein [Crocosphaera sp. UHCC 0190]MEA5509794.1 transposase family protein [Crocosphaera sp. UHCC 0190]
MKRELTKILGFPGVIVTAKETIDNTFILDVEVECQTVICPTCNQLSDRLHQNHWYLVRDINWGEKEIILRVNRRQFKCNCCAKPFSEELDFVGKKKKYTHRYARFIAEQLFNNDLGNVAKRNNLTQYDVKSMVTQITNETFFLDIKNLKRLEIDEINIIKGQEIFKTVFIDLDTGKLVGVSQETRKKILEKIFNAWGNDILEQIEEIRMNLSKTYQTIIENFFPKAIIVVNQFNGDNLSKSDQKS